MLRRQIPLNSTNGNRCKGDLIREGLIREGIPLVDDVVPTIGVEGFPVYPVAVVREENSRHASMLTKLRDGVF
jgi:hypothetical protein